MPSMDDSPVQRLIDESDLRDLIHRYAYGLDRRDWDMWRSVFTDEVLIDMSDYQPDPPPRRLPVDTHLDYVRRLFAGFDTTQHFIGTHRFDIGGDTATITAHMRAEHWATTGEGGDRYTMYGTYTDECVRTPDGWRVSAVKLTLLREEGNRHVMRLAARRGSDPGVAGAMAATDAFLSTFNARDAAAHASTLAYPHVRLASGRVRIWADPDEAVPVIAQSFVALTERVGWDHSVWDHRRVVHSGPGKVNLDAQFTRYRADGAAIASYPAIYVVVEEEGRWLVQSRSSFAP